MPSSQLHSRTSFSENEPNSLLFQVGNTAFVLELPRHVASVTTYWPQARVVGKPLIAHLIERLYRAFGRNLDLFIGCPSPVEQSLVEPVISLYRPNVVVHPVRSDLFRAILSERPSARHLCAFRGDWPFPDCTLSRAMLTEHIAVNRHATFPHADIAGMLPEVYDRSGLEAVAGLNLPCSAGDNLRLLMIKSAEWAAHQSTPSLFRFDVYPKTVSADLRSGLPWVCTVNDSVALQAVERVVQSPEGSEGVGPGAGRLFLKELQSHDSPSVLRNISRIISRRSGLGILFVSPTGGYSGGEDSLVALVERLDRSKYDLHAVVPVEGHMTDRLRRANVDCHVPLRDVTCNSPTNVDYFANILTALNIDVAHVNGIPPAPLVTAAFTRRVPLVAHVRNLYRYDFPAEFKFCNTLICISQAVAADVLRHDIRPDRIERIYNGIDVGHWSIRDTNNTALRSRLGLSQDTSIVLMVARVTPMKRIELLIRAMDGVVKNRPNTVAVIVGEVYAADLSYRRELDAMIANLGLGRHVLFWGFERELRPIYQEASLLVLCTENEPLGRCILEAQAAGLPVIAPDAGGPAEIIQNEQSGVLLNPFTPDRLGASIVGLLNDEIARERLRDGSRLRVRNFSIEQHVNLVQQVYERAIATHRTTDAISRPPNVVRRE